MIVILGGILWMIFSLGHELGYSTLGVREGDSRLYNQWREQLAELFYSQPDNGRSISFSRILGPLYYSRGSGFYAAYQTVICHLTNGTEATILVMNAFLAFWGGLVLTRVSYSFQSGKNSRDLILPLSLIFTPSVLFWSSANLKEALMYWSICQIYSFVRFINSRKQFFYTFIWAIMGAYVGLHIRPHITVFWIGPVLAVKMFERNFRKCGVLFLLLFPLLLFYVDSKIDIPSSIERLKTQAEAKMSILIHRDRKSTFNYGQAGPIPLLSGLKNTQFRPIIWHTSNLRSLLTALEIWTISLSTIFLWLRMTNREWRTIVKNPAIWVALLVLIPFWVFFTYTPNEGLIARQRIQLFPALLVLLAAPILMRKAHSGKGIKRAP